MKSKISFPWRIFLVALVLRLIPVLLTRSLGIGLDDMFQYDMLARSLASGNGYRWYVYEDLQRLEPYVDFDLSSGDYDPDRGVLTSFRPPMYPAFLSLIYLVIGVGVNRFFIVRLVQAFIGAALAPLTYILSYKILNPQTAVISGYDPSGGVVDERVIKTSRAAAWAVTCYPMLIVFPLSLATENLFFVLVLISTLVLLQAAETRKSTHFVMAGALFGLTALTRSVILAVVGLCSLWVWFILREHKSAVLMFLSMLIVISPWVIRNSLLYDRFTGIESSLGYNLYVGYHPEGTGTFQYGISLDLVPILDDGVRDQFGRQAAIQFIRDNPARVPYLALRKLGLFFGLERRAATYFYSNNFFGFVPLPLLILAAFTLCPPFVILGVSAIAGLALIRWERYTVLLALIMIGYLAPHIIIQAEERFHLVLVPFFAILAAKAWTSGWRAFANRWQQSSAGKIAISLAVLAVLLLFLNWGLELSRDADKIAALLGPNGNQTYYPY